MKLITRYNYSFIPALILLFVLFVAVNYFFTRKVVRDQVDENLKRTHSRIVNFVQLHQSLPDVNTFDDLKIKIEPATVPMEKPVIESSELFIPERNYNHRARRMFFTVPLQNRLYKITVNAPQEGLHTMTKASFLISAGTFFVFLLIIWVISRILLSKIWSPFYVSLEKIRAFKVDSNEPLHFPKTEIEEFTVMNNNFELAAGNALKEYHRLKEFTENASHEIQTPLATIRAKLDLLAQQEFLSELQCELLQDTFSAVTRLTKLNQSLLLLTKIENDQFQTTTVVDLDDKLRKKINQFHELWQNSQIFHTSEIAPSEITAHPDLIDILLNNLLSNATRHNMPDGIIRITLKERILKISNTGQYKALNKDRLFMRFYKESASNEHNGLGLSIVQQICKVTQITPAYQYDDGMHTFVLEW